MAKIQVDADEMMEIANEMAREVTAIEDSVAKETTIISSIHDVWKGDDYSKIKRQWDSFTKVKDERFNNQIKQYSKYLFGYHRELVDIRNELVKKAMDLPQW